jgi:hypothetical protein
VSAASTPSFGPPPDDDAVQATDAPTGVSLVGLELRELDALPRLGDGTVSGAALLAALESLDPRVLTDYEQVEVIAAWQRLENFVSAGRWRAMSAFHRTPYEGGAGMREFASDELALRLGCGRRTVERQLNAAYLIDERLPATREARARGLLDATKTQLIAEGTVGLDDDSARAVEGSVIDEATTANPATLRRRLGRAITTHDPAGHERRRAAAVDERRVGGTPLEDGMAELSAYLPAEDWTTINTAINAAARGLKARGDARSMDQLRADALVAPFREALCSGVLAGVEPMTLAQHRGAPARIDVTVPASVLLGLSEAPGYLAGYGWIPASLARELAVDATWRRILTDPATGVPIEVGSTSYAPSPALARLVAGRDRTCRFPGCHARAEAGDLDHTVPFPAGPTTADNLGSLCRRHHRLKHEASGTRLTQDDGTFIWTMPTGHVVEQPPPDHHSPDDPVTDPAVDPPTEPPDG